MGERCRLPGPMAKRAAETRRVPCARGWARGPLGDWRRSCESADGSLPRHRRSGNLRRPRTAKLPRARPETAVRLPSVYCESGRSGASRRPLKAKATHARGPCTVVAGGAAACRRAHGVRRPSGPCRGARARRRDRLASRRGRGTREASRRTEWVRVAEAPVGVGPCPLPPGPPPRAKRRS